jgi:demethylmenaquinone methyltransferase/2-methoxy-6-polyprenyl-1,4-benzoquinol methylase
MRDGHLLDQQIAYYRARAPEYDEWFLRQGRYDRGPEFRARWGREVDEIAAVLASLTQGAEVLELACGTGLWTQRLAASGCSVRAVDASPEVIAINRDRVRSPNVEYQIADIFAWTPTNTFDVVFFSFWLSHVPAERFDGFWELVRSALRPGGHAFFIDGLLEPTSIAQNHDPPDRSGVARRRLNDGREFDIVKVFHEPAELERRLVEQGWSGWVRSTETFFLYGSMTFSRDQPLANGIKD